MNAVVALCHFCETHGPRVLFCCQPFNDEVPVHQRSAQAASQSTSLNGGVEFYGKYDCFQACLEASKRAKGDQSSLDQGQSPSASLANAKAVNHLYCEMCDACRSMGTTFPGFLVCDDENRISYLGSQFPYHPEVFTLVRHACLRSLSCEVCPGREGVIFFGDSVCGYCLSYTFNMKDLVARGFQHLFSIVLVSMDKMLLLNSYEFFVSSLCTIVQCLQSKATRVFEEEQSRDQEKLKRKAAICKSVIMHTTAFLSERQESGVASPPRSLAELTGDPAIFKRLNHAFVWLLKMQNEISVELILEGCPGQDELVELENGCGQISTSDDWLTDSPLLNCTFDTSWPNAEEHKGTCLMHMAKSLNRALFKLLVYHLLIGNQTVVQSKRRSLTKFALGGLQMLLPKGCVRLVEHSLDYLECWRCNLLGVGKAVNLDALHSSSPYFLITVELTADDDDDLDEPVSLDHFLRSSVNVRPNNLAMPPGEYPTLVEHIISILFEGDLSCRALDKLLTALKQQWVNKAKLLYAIRKQYDEDDCQVTARWRRVSRCKKADEALVKFWQAALSRNAKSHVIYSCYVHS